MDTQDLSQLAEDPNHAEKDRIIKSIM